MVNWITKKHFWGVWTWGC